jgi:hypothetical protein
MDEDLKVIKSIVMEEPVVLEFCCKTDSIWKWLNQSNIMNVAEEPVEYRQ